MAVVDAPLATPAETQPFEHLLLDFLAYLEFERGLSRNTLEAYRSDLLQYGAFLRGRGVDARAAQHRDLAAFLTELDRRRGPPAGRLGDAAAQGGVPALVLPPPAPRGDHRARPDGRAASPAQEPAPATGALPRRRRAAARGAPWHGARRAA